MSLRHTAPTQCIKWRKYNHTDRSISYLGTLVKTASDGIGAILRKGLILFAHSCEQICFITVEQIGLLFHVIFSLLLVKITVILKLICEMKDEFIWIVSTAMLSPFRVVRTLRTFSMRPIQS